MSSRRRLDDEFSGTPYTDDYSPDTIYRSVGDLDHAKSSRGVWGNVTMKAVLRQRINRVVAELGKDVYRSVADLERDALEHRCAYWEGQLLLSETTCNELRMSRAEGAINALIEYQTHRESFYEHLKSQLKETRSPEALLLMKLEIEQFASSLTDLYWRDRFLDLVKSY